MTLLPNLSLRTKFLVVPLVVASVFALVAMVIMAAIHSQQTRISATVAEHERLGRAMEALSSDVSSNHVQIFALLAQADTGTDQSAVYDRGKDLLEPIYEFRSRLRAIRDRAGSVTIDPAIVTDLEEALDAYLNESITAVEMTTVDINLAYRSMARSGAAYTSLNEKLVRVLDRIRRSKHGALSGLLAQVQTWSLQFATIMTAAILSMAGLAFLIGHFVARDILANIRIISRLTAGDWNVHVPSTSRRDEVGAMTRGLEVFRDTIRDLAHSEQRTKALNQVLQAEIAQKQEAQGILARQALELEVQATHDVLTGLYNRRHFDARVEADLARTDPANQNFAVILCDLDGFKKYNDSRGHPAGDDLLRRVAKSLKAATRGSDSVYRWGGDEFVLTVFEASRDGVRIAAERVRSGILKIREALNYPDLDVSIGVALYPEHADTIEGLIRLADRALYIAKKGGGNIRIGEEDHTFDERNVAVVFQPILDARLGEVHGHEALVRDPQGLLSIEALFRKYAAIDRLTAFKCLCLAVQIQTAARIGLKRLFVNVDFEMLAAMGVVSNPPGMEVILEISESESIHHIDRYLTIAHRWRDAGFKFAIGDFGAGFLSLPFVAQIIPDYIKLDRSTMREAVTSPKFRRILESLLVGLRNCATDGIIVEGIETAEELEVVKAMGLFLVQGLLLGKPEPLRPPTSSDMDGPPASEHRAA